MVYVAHNYGADAFYVFPATHNYRELLAFDVVAQVDGPSTYIKVPEAGDGRITYNVTDGGEVMLFLRNFEEGVLFPLSAVEEYVQDAVGCSIAFKAKC